MTVSQEHADAIRAYWPRRHRPEFRRILRSYVLAERLRRRLAGASA